MAVHHTQKLSSDMVLREAEALMEWQAQVLRHCFYPDSRKQPVEALPPASLLEWCRQQADKGEIDRKHIEPLTLSYDSLHASAREMMAASVSQAEPYDTLTNRLGAYVAHLGRLQQEVSGFVAVVDPVTGLRTVSSMYADLQREQDRFERKGTSFSIVHIGLDQLQELESRHDRRAMESFYAHLAGIITRTVRSFDDAYFLGRGEYIVVLKHVEFVDAGSVLDRLRRSTAETPVMLEGGGEPVTLTASFGLAEAMHREPYELLLEHAKDALQNARLAGGNRIHEHSELSPFESFVKGKGRE